MNHDQLQRVLEGAIFAADSPLSLDALIKLFPEEERPERDEVRAALEDLQNEYKNRGVELKEVGSGYRFQVREEYATWVQRLWEEKPSKYSRALLETLALIAYRQPITRGEIEEIRGVSVSSTIMKTLHERDWVRVVGHRDVPGRPAMYATTKGFLDYFNLKSLDELPPLAELRDLEEFEHKLDEEVREKLAQAQEAANDAAAQDEEAGEEQGQAVAAEGAEEQAPETQTAEAMETEAEASTEESGAAAETAEVTEEQAAETQQAALDEEQPAEEMAATETADEEPEVIVATTPPVTEDVDDPVTTEGVPGGSLDQRQPEEEAHAPSLPADDSDERLESESMERGETRDSDVEATHGFGDDSSEDPERQARASVFEEDGVES